MKHKLENYYETYKKAQCEPFPISDNELRSMMDNGFQAKQNYRSTISKGKIIMATTSSIILMILSTLFFFGVDTNDTSSMLDSASGIEPATTMQYENNDQIAQFQTNNNNSNYGNTTANSNFNIRQKQNGEYIFVVDSNAKEPHLIRPIILDPSNASCFGMEITADGIRMKYESGYLSLAMQNKMDYFNKKYPENGIAHVSKFIPFKSGVHNPNNEVIDEYTGWDMKNFQSLVPIDIKTLRKFSGSGTYTNVSDAFSAPRGIDDTLMLSIFLQGEKSNRKGITSDLATALAQCLRDGKEFKFLVDKEKFDFYQKMIPVLYQKVNTEDTLTMILLFADLTVGKPLACRQMLQELGFKPLSSQPVQYTPEFLEKYNQIREMYNKLLLEKAAGYKPEYTKFTGINMLELSDKELEKLCIYRTDSGYNFESNNFGSMTDYLRDGGYDTQLDSVHFRTYYSISMKEVNHTGNLVKYRGWDLTKPDTTLPGAVWLEHIKCNWDPYRRAYDVAPQYIYSSLAECNLRAYGNVKFLNMKEKYSNYLPVHLSLGNKNEADSSKLSYSDVIVWIRCSASLLEKLPERYRDRLIQELAVIGQIEKGDINADNACSLLPEQKSYFGLCGRVSGAARNLEVNPMPVRTSAECKFLLLEDRQVRFALYQANGNLVKNLTESRQFSSGIQSENIDFGGVHDGVYFLSLETDKGEMIYTKIVIEH